MDAQAETETAVEAQAEAETVVETQAEMEVQEAAAQEIRQCRQATAQTWLYMREHSPCSGSVRIRIQKKKSGKIILMPKAFGQSE